MELKFEVIGKFKAKQRPRFCKSGFVFTPKDTVMYENYVKNMAIQAMENQEICEAPLEAFITFYCEIPKSYSKKRIEAINNGLEYPTKKPDLDNLAKTILDALNKVCYRDDSQVVFLAVKKRYGSCEKVDVLIRDISND